MGSSYFFITRQKSVLTSFDGLTRQVDAIMQSFKTMLLMNSEHVIIHQCSRLINYFPWSKGNVQNTESLKAEMEVIIRNRVGKNDKIN